MIAVYEHAYLNLLRSHSMTLRRCWETFSHDDARDGGDSGVGTTSSQSGRCDRQYPQIRHEFGWHDEDVCDYVRVSCRVPIGSYRFCVSVRW